MVVSPIADDDKGKSADEKCFLWSSSFSPGSRLICKGPVMLVYCKLYSPYIYLLGFLKHFPVFSFFTTAALIKA